MKQIVGNRMRSNGFIRTAALVAVLAGSFCRQPILADPTGPQALDLRMTMTTGTRISAGEPIVIHYAIKNTAAMGQVTFHAGEKNNEWYTFSLTDAKGRTIKAAPPPTLGLTQGFHQRLEASIPHGSSTEGDVVVTRYLVVPDPGVYTLTVHALASYYFEPDGAWYPEGRPRDMQQVDLTPDFRFPLTVTAADPARLQATAETLRQELLQATGGQKLHDVAIAALFSMPEAQAAASWQAVAADPALDLWSRKEVAEQLAHLATPKAVDILADMYWYPAQRLSTGFPGLDYPVSIPHLLRQIHNTAAPPLQRRIEALFAEHGETLP